MRTYTRDELIADYIKEIEYFTDQGEPETAQLIIDLLIDFMKKCPCGCHAFDGAPYRTTCKACGHNGQENS